MPLSPMMRQYLEVKEEVPDSLLFFRVGDFYEMFFEDAQIASRELELTLTGKDCGLEERAPMCGVPFHALEHYVPLLVEKGYTVAVCDQVEDPALAKGLVKRSVTRIITAGTLTDSSSIGEKKNNFLLSVAFVGKKAGLAWCDVSTGEFYMQEAQLRGDRLKNMIVSVSPGEIITNDAQKAAEFTSLQTRLFKGSAFSQTTAKETLQTHFKVNNLLALGVDQKQSASVCAAGALIAYLQETQKNTLDHIITLRVSSMENVMTLDSATRRNLELTESMRERSARGSLFSVLDKTVTAMGGRLLRKWIENPLTDKLQIQNRLDAVQAFCQEPVLCAHLSEKLSAVYDLERLLCKVAYHNLLPRDCLAIFRSLQQAPDIQSLLESIHCDAVEKIRSSIDPLPSLARLLERAISPEAPQTLGEGGFIREGYHEELDSLRRATREGKQWILDLEARERERTGIKNLKIQYNRVFGYYIEITKSNYSMVPLHYRRKQTLTNAERFTTDELRELEEKLFGSQEKAAKLEMQLYEAIREEIANHIESLQRTASCYKMLDALLSLANAAMEYHYACPELNEEGRLFIQNGRHPVVEQMMPANTFVPNDTEMNVENRRMHIITGPNMAGKSTYMRQVALIVLMAHIGSFVPADSAQIPLVDGIFTRVGASDDLASGQSTFMVEMSELAYILRNATSKSLIILDEIGRGTSTFDGLSIAWSAVEYLTNPQKVGALTLFATHYHELSELEGHLEGVFNSYIAVKEMGEEIIFLRKILPGGTDKSFGIYVARLSGVPHSVVARAQEIEARLEVSHDDFNSLGQNILQEKTKKQNQQMGLSLFEQNEFIEEMKGLDVLAMTPMDALNKLFYLKEKALKL